MMLSLSKIFWLVIILLCVWYLFKIIEKRKVNSSNSKANGESNNRKGIDAYKCEKCGLWSTGDKCNNKECI
jgi:beta-lactamase regulating signal transducer with metallopeptidase domain